MTVDYYVDQIDGDDAAAGTSEATAWRTLAKLSAFSTANPWAITRNVYLRRGADYPGQIRLVNQGHPGRWLRIRPYGNTSAPDPHIVASGVGALEGVVHLDSVLAAWVEDVSVDGGAIPLSPGIGRVSITAPERAAPFRVERCTVVNTGFDSILASFSASVVNGALALPTGSNQQLAGVVIKDNVIDGSRNDGIAVAGSAFDVLIQGNVGSNIAAGTVPPQGGTAGDFISCHDLEGIVRIVDNEVDACVNGIHNVNFGAPCLIDGLRCKNATENCITVEMQEEFAAGGLARLDWMIRNCTLIHGAAATGLAAVLLGRGSLNGSLISARLWNNLIVNKAAVPSVLAKFYNDARSNECVLDLRNNEFSRVHASGRHIEIDRGGRTPFIVSDRNRFDVDAATAFRRDGTDYDLAGWQALGYDADSTVGALGLTGDPETDWMNAIPAAASACRGAGDNLGVREVPYYGAGDTDQRGFFRPPAGAWDLGPLQASGGDIMNLTTLERVKAQLGKTDTQDDAALTEIVTNVSRRMERYMGRDAYLVERTEYLNVQAGRTAFRLRGLPIAAVASVYYDAASLFASDTLLTATTDYVVDEETERLTLRRKPLFDATRALKVTYTGGMAADVPGLVTNGYGDLVQAATNQVISEWKRHALGGVNVESTSGPGGSTSYTRDGWLRSVEDVLDRYRTMDL